MPSKANPIQMNTTYNVGGAVPRPSNPQSAEIMANKQQSKRGGMTPGRTGGQTLRTQGPKRRSLRDIATRRKQMKALAEKQKTMLASGRTKKTTPTPSTKVMPVAGVSGNSGMRTMFNRTRTKKTRPTSTPPVRGRNNNRMPSMFNRSRTRSQNRR